jgi:hypothetical protein
MAEAGRIARPVILLLCIGVSTLGLINVYGDNKDVVAMAEKIACAERPQCTARMTRMSRTPIGQSFTFQVDVKPVATVDVDCNRSAYLLGAWSCQRASP